MKNIKILVTGSSGFIGYSLCKKLLEKRYQVIGIDNHNNYYSIKLKIDRKKELERYKNFNFFKVDIANKKSLKKVFKKFKITHVVNLAAQAGVRFSIKNPDTYIKNNILGFFNVIDLSKIFKVRHLIYASSSSVYGLNKNKMFKESDLTDHPTSLYGATKKSNEIIAHSYSHLFNLPTSGLRFFTVYGPHCRPDMSLFIFTKAIFENKNFNIFNKGKMKRSFSHIDDIINSTLKIIFNPPKLKRNSKLSAGTSSAPYEVYNLGNPNDTKLLDYVRLIEKHIGKKGKKILEKMQMGDVVSTKADISKIKKKFKVKYKFGVNEGIKNFITWYRNYSSK